MARRGVMAFTLVLVVGLGLFVHVRRPSLLTKDLYGGHRAHSARGQFVSRVTESPELAARYGASSSNDSNMDGNQAFAATEEGA